MARGLAPQLIQLPFAAGLNQSVDARAKQAPTLDIGKDVQFHELGGLQTRYPFADMPNAILGGGVLADVRRGVEFGDERLLFTKDTLYSWSERDAAWVSRGTHLAVKVEEETVFAQSMDQVGCDRAELGGAIFYTWTGTNSASTGVYIAAVDKATGNVILPPQIAEVAGGTTPRLLALDTRVLLVWYRSLSDELVGIAIDPANIKASIVAPTVVIPTDHILPYDIVKVPNADSAILVAARSITTSYLALTITSGMVVTTLVKARTCDGPIAVSVDPTLTFVQVARCAAGAIQGDRLNLALADTGSNNVPIGTAVGTVGHLAIAHRSIADGAYYRCYCFWSSSESAGAGVNWTSKSNWVDTNGAHGVEANFVRLLAPASRAFDYAGRVYLWGAFGGATTTAIPGFIEQLQNTFFLYRDDATLVSKACFDNAGGLPPTTMLPGVALVDGTTTFAWCATMRRAVPVGKNAANLGYAERAPRDVVFTFDSNEARRCVRLGQTLYVTGGEILQYDGTGLYEVGFHVYPWGIGANPNGAGALVNGDYAYKATWKWPNAKGDVDRSTTATVVKATVAAGPEGVDVVVNPLFTTRKIAQPPACEIWRTAINPVPEAPFYLVSSGDPSVLAGSNAYLANDPTVFPLPTFHDALTDGSATSLQNNPENGEVLEFLAPPGATVIAATEDRIFLGDVAGDPDRVWYSRQRNDGEVASFHDGLTFAVPRAGGKITAIAVYQDLVVVFREAATYAFPGAGLDNTGGGANYGPARTISSDCGALSAESVAVTPDGVVFKSKKGWYRWGGGLTVDYIGAAIRGYDAEEVLAAHLITTNRELRVLTPNRLLVLYYEANQWLEWSVAGGVHAAIWNDTYTYLTAARPRSEQTTYVGVDYGFDVEMAWIEPDDLQGAARVWWIMPLGEWRSAFHLRVRIARDYQSDGAGGVAYFDDKYWIPSPAQLGAPLQVRIGPSQQQVQAIKVRFTAVDANNHANPPNGEAAKLTGLGLEVGIDPGLFKRLPAAQKA